MFIAAQRTRSTQGQAPIPAFFAHSSGGSPLVTFAGWCCSCSGYLCAPLYIHIYEGATRLTVSTVQPVRVAARLFANACRLLTRVVQFWGLWLYDLHASCLTG